MVDFSYFILLGICLVSWIYRLVSSISWESFFSHYLFKYFFCPMLSLLSFWNSELMKVRLSYSIFQVFKSLFMYFFLLLFHSLIEFLISIIVFFISRSFVWLSNYYITFYSFLISCRHKIYSFSWAFLFKTIPSTCFIFCLILITLSLCSSVFPTYFTCSCSSCLLLCMLVCFGYVLANILEK